MTGITFIVNMYMSSIVYVGCAVFALGFIYKVYFEYYKTPQPLVIPQTPQPVTLSGVILRMAGDVLFFRSLSKGTTFLFITGWIFHFTFLMMIIRHLRYFIHPVPGLITALGNGAMFLSVVLLVSLILLVIRRFAEERTAYVTVLADYVVLFLIIGITMTGIMMRCEPFRPDIVAVNAFVLQLMDLKAPFKMLGMHPAELLHKGQALSPGDVIFMCHLSFVFFLLMYFPFSKLMHAAGYFFSPTRNMVNNPRDVRHVNPWDNS
ncbi:MAG: respiratory nitrate reductase subunit gamma [Nitrospirae bacterium YQR-1]